MPPTTENPSKAPVVAFGATSTDQNFVFPVEKKNIFNTVAPSK